MLMRLLTRALAAVLPREEYLLPRWNPAPFFGDMPLREIVIHGRRIRVINVN